MADHVIAVAEQEAETGMLLSTFLGEKGYRVVALGDASSLSALVPDEHMDAFLVDLDAGAEVGLELCRCIRAHHGHTSTPILCITALTRPEVIAEAFRAGADDFVPKPINLEALFARLRVQIERREAFAKLMRARQMLRRYLSPRVAALAEEYSEDGTLPPPAVREVAICITDIRGFTALSETMDPVHLFGRLSAHLRDQIELVYRHGGYVDKFNGDGLMAIFDGEDMVTKSCLCALDIMELTGSKEGSTDKFPIGIGIHTGMVVMGNIGSPNHLDYSAVGTSVNLAARLCGYAQPETIIVSEAVRETIGEHSRIQFIARREVQVRGVSGPVTIYRLINRIGAAVPGQ